MLVIFRDFITNRPTAVAPLSVAEVHITAAQFDLFPLIVKHGQFFRGTATAATQRRLHTANRVGDVGANSDKKDFAGLKHSCTVSSEIEGLEKKNTYLSENSF